MTVAEKHIRHYNHLNGKVMSKAQLSTFHAALRKDIDAKRIDAHMPLGVECIDVEKRIAAAIKKMGGGTYPMQCKVVPVDKILEASKIEAKRKAIARKKKTLAGPAPEKVDVQPLAEPVKKEEPAKPLPFVKKAREPKAAAPAFTLKGLGFVTAAEAPAKPANTFTLSGEIGRFLGQLQAYKLEIVVAGETHSGKSEIGKQIADAFSKAGFTVGYLDWEQGGVGSKDTIESVNRNFSPESKKKIVISGDVPRDLDTIKKLAKMFQVILLDSGTKMNQVTNAWIDELREEYPDTIWVPLMQQNGQGGTRGGAAAEFDAPVVIKTYRGDHGSHTGNYAIMFKNRGNKTGLRYNISSKKIVKQTADATDK